ncbi:MAG: hypothetical protein EIB84_01675 [Spiroplasma poulsonii]|nr:hypothetical protein [Spiroplasma poulsonii]
MKPSELGFFKNYIFRKNTGNNITKIINCSSVDSNKKFLGKVSDNKKLYFFKKYCTNPSKKSDWEIEKPITKKVATDLLIYLKKIIDNQYNKNFIDSVNELVDFTKGNSIIDLSNKHFILDGLR